MKSFELIPARRLTESGAEEIEAFLDSQEGSHPFLFPAWIRSSEGRYPPGASFGVFRENGQIQWIARCYLVYPLGKTAFPLRALTMPRGPCGNIGAWDSALKGMRNAADRAGLTFLEASPELVDSGAPQIGQAFRAGGWLPFGEGRTSLRLDLTRDDEALLAGLRKTTRYEVQKAERVGVKVEAGLGGPQVPEFIGVYSATAARKGFATDPIDHLQGIFSWLAAEPTRGTILVARHEEKVIGGVVIVRAAKRCWYVWGASEKCDVAAAGPILQWRALLWAKTQGCTEYDFGGYQENAKSGPALFKKGFGGEVVRFLPPQRVVVSQRRHRIFTFLSRIRSAGKVGSS